MKPSPSLAVRRDLVQLERRFQTAREAYEEVRARCEGGVTRWQWANGPVYAIDPLFFLDRYIREGQISPQAPSDPRSWTAYGFTEDDRLTVERQYTELPDALYYQNLYIELADRIIGYRFDYTASRAPVSCSQLVMEDSRPSHFQRWGSRGWFAYTFTCSGNRVDSYQGVAKEPDEPEMRFSGQVFYKDGGIVELWTKEHGQRKAELTFRGKPPVDNPFIRARERRIK